MINAINKLKQSDSPSLGEGGERLSLLELNALVRRSLEQCLPDEYWIQAELSDVRSNTTGHCYLEFVQKDPRSNNLVAKARGMIWNNIYRLLKPYFEETTGQLFTSGIKVLVKVTVQFHELYGYSLTVLDIDPAYTLGDMARRRREILLQLEEEGVLTLNKELEIPFPMRIAALPPGWLLFLRRVPRPRHHRHPRQRKNRLERSRTGGFLPPAERPGFLRLPSTRHSPWNTSCSAWTAPHGQIQGRYQR